MTETMFDEGNVAEFQRRIGSLTAETRPLWGKMTAAQMVVHCRRGVEMALGELRPKRILLGRVLGGFIKKMAMKDGEPFRKNSPTADELRVSGDGLDFEAEREALRADVARFSADGPEGCTTHPHAFFGKLTPQEWSKLMHKHLDHHLRQFGV